MSALAPSRTQYLIFAPESDENLREGKNALLVYYGKDAQAVTPKTLGPSARAAIKKNIRLLYCCMLTD